MKAGACEFEEDGEKGGAGNKKPNGLPIWGNEKTMNLNPLILTNIQSSQYFKVNLYQLKTYHEVIDEIYYNVTHLEPWEKGSRKTSGQTGMCGGVRGVGAGGIVSTAFCILYKLYTLRLSRKQVVGLLNHTDSPYIRGLGFMYVRFTQPPADLWDWLEPYLDDEEEIDVRAGGGQTTTIGHTVRHMLSKLEWYSTLFPRIPVPIQKELEKKLSEHAAAKATANPTVAPPAKKDWYGGRPEAEAAPQKEHGRPRGSSQEYSCRDNERVRDVDRERDRGRERDGARSQDQEKDRQADRAKERNGDHDRSRNRHRDRERDRAGLTERDRAGPTERDRAGPTERDRAAPTERDRDRERDRERDRGDRGDREKEKDRDRGDKERERERDHHKHREGDHSHDKKHRRRDRISCPDDKGDFAELLEREKHRIKKERKKDGSRERSKRSRSPDKDRRRHH